MNHQSLGSAIYLNNIDDYNSGLSQACINPIFTSLTGDAIAAAVVHNQEQPPLKTPPTSAMVTPSTTTNDFVRSNMTLQSGSGGVRSSRRSRARMDQKPPIISYSSIDTDVSTTTQATTSTTTSTATNAVVTATIADCLACSGCVTTAETVLLQEQHSLTKLKEQLLLSGVRSNGTERSKATSSTGPDNDKNVVENGRIREQKAAVVTVVSISPASIADLCRFLKHPQQQQKPTHTATTKTAASSTQLLQYEIMLQQLTIILHKYLNVNAVLDCTVTLQTTLQIAAQEFCQAFRNSKNNNISGLRQQQRKPVPISNDETYEQKLFPSVAISSQQTQYWLPPSVSQTTSTEVVDRSQGTLRNQQLLPIISSSCPAIVCLIEKSYPTMVPHLSTVISPMIAAAHQFWMPFLAIRNELASRTSINNGCATSSEGYNTTENINPVQYYHLAVMPCHDKKLEASRNDFREKQDDNMSNSDMSSRPSSYRPIVDMVITTMELVQLLYDAITLRNGSSNDMEIGDEHDDENIDGNEMYDVVRRSILSVSVLPNNVKNSIPIKIDCSSFASGDYGHVVTNDTLVKLMRNQTEQCDSRDRPYLFTMSPKQMSNTTSAVALSTNSPLFVKGSGGYADFIFRYVAKHIFHLDCPTDTSIWRPFVENDRRNGPPIVGSHPNAISSPVRMSARTASHRKQREFYEATISRNSRTGEYSVATTTTTTTTTEVSSESANDCAIVLRFVIAYGMSVVQNVLTKITSTVATDQRPPKVRHDYFECMACPHSCLNGNGQIRSSGSNDVAVREAPSDIKLRIQQTQMYYSVQHHHIANDKKDVHCCDDSDMTLDINKTIEPANTYDRRFYTRYHIVPPMQHTMGVTAGIAVQDILW